MNVQGMGNLVCVDGTLRTKEIIVTLGICKEKSAKIVRPLSKGLPVGSLLLQSLLL